MKNTKHFAALRCTCALVANMHPNPTPHQRDRYVRALLTHIRHYRMAGEEKFWRLFSDNVHGDAHFYILGEDNSIPQRPAGIQNHLFAIECDESQVVLTANQFDSLIEQWKALKQTRIVVGPCDCSEAAIADRRPS